MGREISREITSKRLRARYLIVVKGYSQKAAAELVGVSAKTMCKWVEKFKWDEQKENEVLKVGGFSAILDGWLKYVKQERPGIHGDVSRLWSNYLKRLELEHNST